MYGGVTHIVIIACNYPLSTYMNCNSSCGSINSELPTIILCYVVITILFLYFQHYHPYILQHFNETFFTFLDTYYLAVSISASLWSVLPYQLVYFTIFVECFIIPTCYYPPCACAASVRQLVVCCLFVHAQTLFHSLVIVIFTSFNITSMCNLSYVSSSTLSCCTQIRNAGAIVDLAHE